MANGNDSTALSFILTVATITRLLFDPDYRRKLMAALEQLQQAIMDVKNAAGDMASRVDGVINDLRTKAASPQPTPDTISAADAQQAASDLEAVAAQLKGIQAQPTPATGGTSGPATSGGSTTSTQAGVSATTPVDTTAGQPTQPATPAPGSQGTTTDTGTTPGSQG